MTRRPHPDHLPDRETLLMMLSAYLDGELAGEEEALVLDALSQDAELLEAFEAMSAARLDAGSALGLSDDESEALTAAVMAETNQAEVPATTAGAMFLASLGVDDALDGPGRARLDEILQKPASRETAPVVAGFVFSVEATQVAAQAVAETPSVRAALRALPDHVDARLAAAERVGVLASAAGDDALTPAENDELAALLGGLRGDPDGLLGIVADVWAKERVGEALRASSRSPAVSRLAARAGAAALQVIEAENLQRTAAAHTGSAARDNAPAPPAPSWLARLWGAMAVARAPLALAGAAAAVFFLLRDPAGRGDETAVARRHESEQALFQALAQNVLVEEPLPASVDLPLLADNSADVEAIDATDTTVVFSTESSNITIIWLASDDDAEQGT